MIGVIMSHQLMQSLDCLRGGAESRIPEPSAKDDHSSIFIHDHYDGSQYHTRKISY